MADKNLNSITFPGLPDKYKIAQVAEEYSSSSTYAVGDIVNHLGTTYKCTTAISTAEAWTAGHWTEVKVANEVTDLKSALDTDYLYTSPGKNIYDPSKSESGRLYANNAGVAQTHTTSTTEVIQKIPALPSTSYAFRGVSYYSFVDSNNILLINTTGISSNPTVATSPAGTAFLWVQCKTANSTTTAQVEISETVTDYEPYNGKEFVSSGGEKLFDLPIINDSVQKENSTYSSQKTEQVIDSKVADQIAQLPDYIHFANSKNLYDPSKSESGRLYANNAGVAQTHTTSTTDVIQKMVASPGTTYALTGFSNYSFVDENNILLINTTSVSGSGTSRRTVVTAPTGTAYIWLQSNASDSTTFAQLEVGDTYTVYEPYREKASLVIGDEKVYDTKDLPSVFDMDESSIVSPDMSKAEFCAAVNAEWSDYATLNKIHTSSFFVLPVPSNETSITWDFIYKTLNHNFRKTVATNDMSKEMICNNVNKAFNSRIYRFCDAKPYTGDSRDYSLSTGLQADEPSAIVSDDGKTLYIYAHLKRIETVDGTTWSEATNLVLSDSTNVMHVGVNKIDGVYYLIGARQNEGGDLVLYTSTDGINFAYKGTLFESGYEFHNNYTVNCWGNPYLVKDYSTGDLVLFIETQKTNTPWEINVAVCTNILQANLDGTIGDWVPAENNPVIMRPYTGYTNNSNSAGNPDFFKNADGQPIRFEGKYYMYFHSTLGGYTNIVRAYSDDLLTWTVEGPITDNRDAPSGGDDHAGNGDHCIVEFKGKSYLFYSWDINDPNRLPYIKYVIDDRSASDMLAIAP